MVLPPTILLRRMGKRHVGCQMQQPVACPSVSVPDARRRYEVAAERITLLALYHHLLHSD
jgi:hypothetical protein